jgi:protein-S-isoprenylcysteine O-methyltransferase Ste14
MLKMLLLLCVCLGSQVMAHPGHGEASPHSHASDLFGLLILAVVLAGIWWETRK